MKRMHIIARGRVQGVFYRKFARDAAIRYNIVGWARNLLDGNVEIIAEGPVESLTLFIRELRNGPSASHVEDLDITHQDATGEFEDFEIRY